jgi:hypothetical protein
MSVNLVRRRGFKVDDVLKTAGAVRIETAPEQDS